MAIPHAEPSQVISVRPLGAALAGAKTETLVKTKTLEVIRIVMTAGKRIERHAVAGEITVQCLEGSVEFGVGEIKRELTAGTMLFLEGADEHSLHSKENSSLLVTIGLSQKSLTAR